MKEKVIVSILNLLKVKSIVTFVTLYVFVYLVKTQRIEAATTTAILMLVFKELFDKNKTVKEDNNDGQNIYK